MNSPRSSTFSAGTVSYTHLDVYKRQVISHPHRYDKMSRSSQSSVYPSRRKQTETSGIVPVLHTPSVSLSTQRQGRTILIHGIWLPSVFWGVLFRKVSEHAPLGIYLFRSAKWNETVDSDTWNAIYLNHANKKSSELVSWKKSARMILVWYEYWYRTFRFCQKIQITTQYNRFQFGGVTA